MSNNTRSFKWILLGILVVFISGWAMRVFYPMIQERPDQQRKKARFAESVVLVSLLSDYRASHGAFPETLTNLTSLIESSRSSGKPLRPAANILADYTYLRPNSLMEPADKTFSTPILIERMDHYKTQDGAHVGMVAGTVRWYYRTDLIKVLREHNIPPEACSEIGIPLK